MKKITLKALTIIIATLGFEGQAQYCAASCTGQNYGLYVETVVTTGGTTNINHTGGSGTDYYLSVAETLTIPVGGTFNIATTPGGAGAPGVRAVIYIDYNGDGDFEDSGEFVGAMSPEKVWRDPAPTDNMNITVPATATVGATKMRILGGDAWAYNDDMTGNDPDGPGIPASPCGDLANASFKDFDVQIEASLGVDDLSNNVQFSVYPNPLKGDFINLGMNAQNQKVGVKLYNITGKLIFETQFKSFTGYEEIQVPSLVRGIYLLNVKTNNGSFTKKIIK